MTRTLRFGIALLIAGALGACSSLIPDQAIEDAFGLDGVQVTATAGGVAKMDVSPSLGGSNVVSGSFATQLVGDGSGGLPGFVNVTSISDVITIQAAVGVSSPGDIAFAPSYTITGVSIGVVVTNGGMTILDRTWDESDLDLTFSGSATYDAGSDTTSGTYTVETEVPLVTVLVQGPAVSEIIEALGDGDTLDVAGEIVVTLEPAFPVGADVTFTLKSLGGTLTF